MPCKPHIKIEFVSDEKAESLEKAGFYRHAAARWLVVFDEYKCPAEREWISGLRSQCLRLALRPPVLLDTFGDVHSAASRTQQKMGIDKPAGKVFYLEEWVKSKLHHGE